MYSDHFVAAHGFFLQCLFAPLGAGAATLPGFGPAHFELMRQVRRLGTFGVMLLDARRGRQPRRLGPGARAGAHRLSAVVVGSRNGWRSPPSRAWS